MKSKLFASVFFYWSYSSSAWRRQWHNLLIWNEVNHFSIVGGNHIAQTIFKFRMQVSHTKCIKNYCFVWPLSCICSKFFFSTYFLGSVKLHKNSHMSTNQFKTNNTSVCCGFWIYMKEIWKKTRMKRRMNIKRWSMRVQTKWIDCECGCDCVCVFF